MKANLNAEPRREESLEGKELEENAEVKLSSKSHIIKLRSSKTRSGAESSEEEAKNHAMARFHIQYFSFQLFSTRHDMRQVRKLKKLAQLRKDLELPGFGFRIPKSIIVDEEKQQEMNRTSREEMLRKLVEKEIRLKESLSFAGRKTGDLTDSGCRTI